MSASEFVNTYPLDESSRMLFPMERKKYYDDLIQMHKSWEDPKKSVEVIQVFLFNLDWEIIVQKRASTKRHNANLLDKSIWGHIRVWDTPDHTVMIETVQELEVPSFVVHWRNEFLNKLSVLKDYLHTMALVKYVDCNVNMFTQIFEWEAVKVPKKYHLYLWVYGGSTRTIDKEAKWVLRYSVDELDFEMEKYPEMFTDDFLYFMKNYRSNIESFIEDIKHF